MLQLGGHLIPAFYGLISPTMTTLADKIRGGVEQGTMWEVQEDVAAELCQELLARASHPAQALRKAATKRDPAVQDSAGTRKKA